jgi:ATP-dependent phosphofructokinase / diphosphate-dependent phosphofructokinase
MKRRIGILTSGGDCPGLNAAIRGVARAAYELFEVEIIGIHNGYGGLIDGDFQEMAREQFSGILTLGGTILGTSRQPFRTMTDVDENGVDKVSMMKKTYKKLRLDCLVTLGGNGTHRTANLLSQEGLNVIGMPKTIDNDITGTDYTFGFHSAMDIATEVIDRIHTTANSHGRCIVVEIMGNKAGWLTLYSGIAGGADVIVIPEIPYDIQKIAEAVRKREERNKFSIIAVAEGAVTVGEAGMKKKDREELRKALPCDNVSRRIAKELTEMIGVDTRNCVPGHIQRGGSPCAFDRVLATRLGVHAAELIRDEIYGVTVALNGKDIAHNKLEDIAGSPKLVEKDNNIVATAKTIGICFGD